ncbi:MAG: hypothetical protein ACRDSZ_23885 [Pseudonocardiaceae bacterium]
MVYALGEIAGEVFGSVAQHLDLDIGFVDNRIAWPGPPTAIRLRG